MYLMVYLMIMFKTFCKMIETMFERKTKALRSDIGGEYT